jgi:PadR family transcriptional regulator, regulatory protein PadR
MPRRKVGTLLPLEVDILEAGLGQRHDGTGEFHGFQLATWIADGGAARRLTAHGTLYKALGRLEDEGLLSSRWEDPDLAVQEGRPRRRLYTVTGEGARRLAAWQQQHGAPTSVRPGWQAGT